MKAVCWYGKQDVRIDTVPEPVLLDERDAIIKVSASSINTADLNIYNGLIPEMQQGDILGREFMGEIVQVGERVENISPGDRVVIPYVIACGSCSFCQQGLWSLCQNSNPNTKLAEQRLGYVPAGLFGSSHLFGGYAGGQAEYVRIPYGDVGPVKVPPDVSDEQALLLAETLPTAYQAVEKGDVQEGDIVVVWGCGPVGQFAIQAAFARGAYKVIAVDQVAWRLRLAQSYGKAQAINELEINIGQAIRDLTAGRGADVCIDATEMSPAGAKLSWLAARLKNPPSLINGSGQVLEQAIKVCRKGGRLVIAGDYAGHRDRIPLGIAYKKSLSIRMGRANVHTFIKPLLEKIRAGTIDARFVLTHEFDLAEATYGYRIMKDCEENCMQVVLNV
jgi:threonine dehydrogenase-like Zn-dependent dehydrogenase